MANTSYLYAVGEKTGQVKGGCTQKGREDAIACIAHSHAIARAPDPQSGLPTAHRVHKPWTITKELDKASPLLYHILCTNETLSTVTIKFWTAQIKPQTGVGGEVQHYTVKMTNANIASIDFHKANIRYPDLVKLVEYEEISLTYQKIEWTWSDGAITAADDWLNGR